MLKLLDKILNNRYVFVYLTKGGSLPLTRKGLFKTSAILSIILSAILFAVSIVELLKQGYFGRTQTGSGMVVGVGENIIIGYFCLAFGGSAFLGGCLLLISLLFYKSKSFKGLLIVSSFFIILSGAVLNLNALILYLAIASNDEKGFSFEKFKNKSSIKNKATINGEKLREQIVVLRKMRDNGEITDEEFRYMLSELIDRKN